MSGSGLDKDTRRDILALCREEIEGEILAAAASPSYACGREEKKRRLDVTLILNSEGPRLLYERRSFRGLLISALAVDRSTFEKDVEKDWLGGMLVESLLMPYDPLLNDEFLWSREVKAKRRLIIEIIENLILEYPEMSREMLIKPEFFMWEAIARKASLYPPIICKLISPTDDGISLKAQKAIMRGFKAALIEAERDGRVTIDGEFVRISDEYVDIIRGRRPRLLMLLRNVRNSILRHSIEVFPKMMLSLFEDYYAYVRKAAVEGRLLPELEDTKRFIYIPTSSGLVSLSEKLTLSEFARRMLPEGRGEGLRVERLGGVLNSVYLVTIPSREGAERRVVKVFKSWYGLKWFPLALWALGTRGFAVMGKTRLEREYAINRFLSSRGVRVPRVIRVSPAERLIFQEYVEGESVAGIIKRICSSGGDREELYSVIRKVGEEIAKVHSLGVSLGDCKPENMKLTGDGRICFLDLEQSERGGDQAWDIAEFLYYLGHYAYMSPIRVPRRMTESFIDGYLGAGGDAERIMEARSPKYLKVFSFFTPPHILYVIANTCKRRLDERRAEDE